MRGGEKKSIDTYEEYIRSGGGAIDNYRYMHNFDKAKKNVDFKLSAAELKLRIFGTATAELGNPYKFGEYDDYVWDTNPGPTYNDIGFKKKIMAYASIKRSIFHMLQLLETGDIHPSLFHLAWRTGGRPKLGTVERMSEKARKGSALGRAIWMCDAEEAILGKHFTRHFDHRFSGNPLLNKVMINFNKFADSGKLRKWLMEGKSLIELDYSKFDSSVTADVIKKAFDVFELCFTNWTSINRKVYAALQNNFINSRVHMMDRTIVQKHSGVPSGSAFTSIINSICNCIMLEECFERIGTPRNCWKYLVYGDDTLILLGDLPANEGPYYVSRQLRTLCQKLFDTEIEKKSIHVIHKKDFYVGVKLPHYKESRDVIEKGTSRLRPISYERRSVVEGAHVYENAPSHRWSYDFSRTWSFLKYSMLPSGRMIRPAFECFVRLYHPERKIRSWIDHMQHIKMILLENYNNMHVVNRAYHYMYDVWWMIKHGVEEHTIPSEAFCKYHDRMWYRQVDYYCGLDVPEMAEYNNYWKRVCHDIEYALNKLEIGGEEYYLKWHHHKTTRRVSMIKRQGMSSHLYNLFGVVEISKDSLMGLSYMIDNKLGRAISKVLDWRFSNDNQFTNAQKLDIREELRATIKLIVDAEMEKNSSVRDFLNQSRTRRDYIYQHVTGQVKHEWIPLYHVGIKPDRTLSSIEEEISIMRTMGGTSLSIYSPMDSNYMIPCGRRREDVLHDIEEYENEVFRFKINDSELDGTFYF